LPELVRALDFDRERMRAAISADMYATDRAVELAAAGVPFRTAYRQVAEEAGALEARTPEESLAARTSPGATGDLGLSALRTRLAAR
jgi:argininosuccinate lyase